NDPVRRAAAGGVLGVVRYPDYRCTCVRRKVEQRLKPASHLSVLVTVAGYRTHDRIDDDKCKVRQSPGNTLKLGHIGRRVEYVAVTTRDEVDLVQVGAGFLQAGNQDLG